MYFYDLLYAFKGPTKWCATGHRDGYSFVLTPNIGDIFLNWKHIVTVIVTMKRKS